VIVATVDRAGANGTNFATCRVSPNGPSVEYWSTQSTVPILDSREDLRDLVVLPSGYFIAAGTLPGVSGDSTDYALIRLNPSFVEGLSFGPDPLSAWTTVGFEYPVVGVTNDIPKEIFIEPDGEILVGGTIHGGGLDGAVALAHFTADGLLDTADFYDGEPAGDPTPSLSTIAHESSSETDVPRDGERRRILPYRRPSDLTRYKR